MVLGQVVAEQVVVREAGAVEVEVVEEDVFDAGLGQVGGERLLPDPLGEPGAADVGTEVFLEILGIRADLPDPVAAGDHRQDRLIEPAAEDLDPTGFDHRPQSPHVPRLMLDEPLQERPRGVEDEGDLRVVLHHVEERPVAEAICLVEHAVEVADGLVVVEGEDEADCGHGWRS